MKWKNIILPWRDFSSYLILEDILQDFIYGLLKYIKDYVPSMNCLVDVSLMASINLTDDLPLLLVIL